MEQRGCNAARTGATPTAGAAAQTAEIFVQGRVCYQSGQHGKEGFDGSSLSEGLVRPSEEVGEPALEEAGLWARFG